MSSAWDVQLQSLETQVGTIDALETLSAAYSPDGWLGGLDGVSRILARYPNTILKQLEQLRFHGRPDVSPVTCSVATSEGLRRCVIEDAEYAFGGDICSQLIGLTICALSYECDGGNSVELFMEVLGSYLFKDLDDVRVAIYGQLNQNYIRILNEGAARGLTNRFTNVLASLNIHSGDRVYLRKKMLGSRGGLFLPSEVAMLGGFLAWMAKYGKGAYFTKSGLIVRVAACLKAVGYRIGEIQVWAGAGKGELPPKDTDTIPVVLFPTGSFPPDSLPLDPLELDEEDIVGRTCTLHYDYHTAGSMLLSALNSHSDVNATVYQAQFEEIYDYLETNLNIKYEVSLDVLSALQARASWQGSVTVDYEDIEMKLAEMYLPRSAERISPCYKQIATKEALAEILKSMGNFGCFDEYFPESLSMFRAISAAIAISFASRLAPRNFKTTRHCILLDLDNEGWLEEICEVADQVMAVDEEPKPLPFERAASFLAAVHSAGDPEDVKKADFQTIGSRNGIYAVVPTLFVEMAPVREAIGLQCLDTFLANVMVDGDHDPCGAIKASITPASCRKFVNEGEGEDGGEDEEEDAGNVSKLPSSVDPDVGPAIPGPPDVPLSLSFGPPIHINGAYLCLRANVKGSIIETVSINDVLQTLAASQGEPSGCSHQHPSTTEVFNVKPSVWAASKRAKPMKRKHPTFVPVQGDRAWTLFLAGQAKWFSGRIVYRCVDCALACQSTEGSTTVTEGTDDLDMDTSSESGTDVSWSTMSTADDEEEEDIERSNRTVLIGYHQLIDSSGAAH